MIGRTPRSSDSNIRKIWLINHVETFKGSFAAKREHWLFLFDFVVGCMISKDVQVAICKAAFCSTLSGSTCKSHWLDISDFWENHQKKRFGILGICIHFLVHWITNLR